LAKGIIEEELPILVCEPSNINLPIKVDEAVRFEIEVRSGNRIPLKGVAYSDNIRVRVVDSTFGGIKNILVLEINSENLNSNEKIEGSITLVTNAGEKEIPYVFYIKNTDTVLVLNSLKTVDDFMVIAKEDMSIALAIFMYKDFCSSGFMKDIKLQKLYETLSRGNDFRSNLENFLQAAGNKEAVSFQLESSRLDFASVEEEKTASIKVYKENWGLLDIDVSTNAGYIKLNKDKIKNEDFADNVYELEFSIDPDLLDDKKNIANINFKNGLNEKNLEIVINKNLEKEYQREARLFERKQWINYFKLRIEFELSNDKIQKNEILFKMLAVLDRLLVSTYKSLLVKLLKAEIFLMQNDKAGAKSTINSIDNKIKENKHELRDEYLILEYLDTYMYPDAEKIRDLCKLVKDLYKKDHSIIELVLILNLDNTLVDNPAEKQRFLKRAFELGDRSSILMMEYARLLCKNPHLLNSCGTLEVLALSFGIRNNLISISLSEKILEVVRETKRVNGAILNILLSIYNALPSNELLSDICEIFINGNVRKSYVNKWYERCIEKGLQVDRIYEYFIYSLPERYDVPMPESALKYFERINSMTEEFKLRIFENVVEYYQHNSEIYRAYIKRIKIFTIDNAMKLKMDEHLINIYSGILEEDDIDERLAKIIPFLINSYNIYVPEDGAKSIIVVYPELNGEKIYELKDKRAYIALYSDNAVILIEDEAGNRYYSKDMVMDKIFHMQNLVERAYEIDKDHDMRRLEKLDKIADGVGIDVEDVSLIENAVEEIDIDQRFRNKLMSRLIEYFWESSKNDKEINFELLNKTGVKSLNEDNIFMYCDTLMNIGNKLESIEIIKSFGIEHIKKDNLLTLVSKAIEDEAFERNKILSNIAFTLYKVGEFSDKTLEFIAKTYNGRTIDMFECLKTCVEQNVETYDFEERVLIQMLFSNQTTNLDEAFGIYADRKRVTDIIIRAYFTIKSDAFFMNDEETSDAVFEYLEDGLNDVDDIKEFPNIYMLALSKYYSRKEKLNFKQTRLCEMIVKNLCDEDMIFSYFKSLAKFVYVDRDILESVFIEYKGEKEGIVLNSKILPLSDIFEEEEFPNVYKNIFVKYKKIFADEIWEYQIVQNIDGNVKVLANDCVQFEKEEDARESRFILINDMEDLPEGKDEEMKKKLTEFIYKDELVDNLFVLI
jgi:hypothetical protein